MPEQTDPPPADRFGEDDTGEIRPFVDTLRWLERGVFLDDLDRLQHELLSAIAETRKGGSLTVTLTYKPTGRGQIGIRAQSSAKIPSEPPPESLFFVTDAGNLSRDVPGQGKLFAGEHGPEAVDVRRA